MKRQRGAYLVMMTLLIVILIGIAALAIDVGRLLVMRGEMQNGVDAAALAAAAELDSDLNARNRARSAARNLLEHDARFARVREVLGDTGLPLEAFEFFCVIGSRSDVGQDVTGFNSFCPGTPSADDPNKVSAQGDADAHYVRITLDPGLVGDGDRFTANLLFLPVLRAIGIEAAQTAGAVVRALAGRSFFTCNYPPMAICDPWESSGSHFRDEMQEGWHMELRQQGSNQWSSGNFGFLQPPNAGPGAGDVSEFIANEGNVGCTPPRVTTQTGSMTGKTRAGWNTRFGIYEGPAPFQSYSASWPPAPNVIRYPLDAPPTHPVDSRIGQGNWDFEDYWEKAHGNTSFPNGWSNVSRPTRHEVYRHEVNESAIPPAGIPSAPPGDQRRRVMNVAVLSCEALGLTGGKKSGVVFPRDGFAEVFLVRPAEGPPDVTFYAEFVRWVEGTDQDFFVDVQLYE